MLLLNLCARKVYIIIFIKFTFQYASIKPSVHLFLSFPVFQFTFQYASIKPFIISPTQIVNREFTFQYASIKPLALMQFATSIFLFTFQYASIKPTIDLRLFVPPSHLHFNMLLLNPQRSVSLLRVVFIYISICFY